MAESTVWRVMHPDGSRTVVGDYMLALAYCNPTAAELADKM